MSVTELTAHARERPDHPAFVVPGLGARTYAELDDRSSRLAAHLVHARGLEPEAVVAILMDNVPEYAEACWAPLRSGLRVAPLNTHLHVDELGALLRAAAPGAILTDAANAERVDPALRLVAGEELDAVLAGTHRLPDAEERAGARLVYSSGTTGLPKAMREPLPPAAENPDAPLPPPRLGPLMARLGVDQDAVVLSPGPAYHSAPYGFTSTTQRLGGTAVITAGRFDPEACLRQVAELRVTHLHLVPTMLVRLLRLPKDVRATLTGTAASTLRAIVLGGAPCPPLVKAQALDLFGPIVHEYYGASEGYGQTYVSPREALQRPGTIGRLVKGTVHVTGEDGAEIPPGEVGRIWFAGTPQVTYDSDDEKTQAARDPRGWSRVGDLGRVDDDGYLYLAGREGLTVITGGVNVHPQEVEDVLVAHPAVEDAGAFGVPDEEYGELLVALVTPSATGARAAADGTLPDVLREHCRAQLSRHKCPRAIVVTGSVPRSPAGKLRVKDAQAQYQEVHACPK